MNFEDGRFGAVYGTSFRLRAYLLGTDQGAGGDTGVGRQHHALLSPHAELGPSKPVATFGLSPSHRLIYPSLQVQLVVPV